MAYKYKIEQDEYSESPREWDNLGIMAFFHKRYSLGDDHNLSIEDVREIEKSDDYVSLPVYMLDHRDICISSKTTFSEYYMGLDSGQLGIIFVSKEDIRSKLGIKRVTNRVIDRVINLLHSEVETYNQYVTGDVYSFVILDEDEEVIEFCCGFYGYNECKSEVESLVEYLTQHTPQQLEFNL